MSLTSDSHTRKARKRHVCWECDQPIEKGEIYLDSRTFGDGGAGTFRSHPECEAEAWAQMKAAGFDLWDDRVPLRELIDDSGGLPENLGMSPVVLKRFQARAAACEERYQAAMAALDIAKKETDHV